MGDRSRIEPQERPLRFVVCDANGRVLDAFTTDELVSGSQALDLGLAAAWHEAACWAIVAWSREKGQGRAA